MCFTYSALHGTYYQTLHYYLIYFETKSILTIPVIMCLLLLWTCLLVKQHRNMCLCVCVCVYISTSKLFSRPLMKLEFDPLTLLTRGSRDASTSLDVLFELLFQRRVMVTPELLWCSVLFMFPLTRSTGHEKWIKTAYFTFNLRCRVFRLLGTETKAYD